MRVGVQTRQQPRILISEPPDFRIKIQTLPINIRILKKQIGIINFEDPEKQLLFCSLEGLNHLILTFFSYFPPL